MTEDELQALIEEATADFAAGDNAPALAKLGRATAAAPDSFAAWHALFSGAALPREQAA